MSSKRALICGISGQDGALLGKFLLEKGYEVWGTSRDVEACNFSNLHKLGIIDRVTLRSLVATDFKNVLSVLLQAKPNEIYFLGSQSSVSLSFTQPVETIESIVNGTLNFLESIRIIGLDIKFFHPSSSECFGNVENLPANEQTALKPLSPYGVAKTAAHHLVSNYRDSYNIFACNGILFNHESHLRPPRFVIQKIVQSAISIAEGNQTVLKLGRLDIVRDWGWAPKFVEGMWLALQHESPEDYVFATGEPNSLQSVVDKAFKCFGLSWQTYVVQDESLFRPSEIKCTYGDPTKIKNLLGWDPEFRLEGVIEMMVDYRKNSQ